MANQSFSNMRPEQKTRFEKWYTEKVSIPPEMLREEPFCSETLEAMHAFNRLWIESGSTMKDTANAWFRQRRLESGETTQTAPVAPSLDEWRDKLEPYRPILAAWRKVVKQPDYRTEIWFVPQLDVQKDPSPLGPEPARFAYPGYLLSLESRILIEDDRVKEALENVDALLASTHTGPCPPPLFRKWLAAELAIDALDVCDRISVNRANPILRKQLLQLFEKYPERQVLEQASDLDPVTVVIIDQTLGARYQGLIPDFQNKTGWEIAEEWERVQWACTGSNITLKGLEPAQELMISLDEALLSFEKITSHLKHDISRILDSETSEEPETTEISLKAFDDKYRTIEMSSSRLARTAAQNLHRATFSYLYLLLDPSAISTKCTAREARLRQRYEQVLGNLKAE